MKKGTIYGGIAYFLWGIFPVYWKLLKSVQPLEILCHRIVWSLFFVSSILFIIKRWSWLKQIKARPSILLLFMLTAAILALNWLTFIWAVNNGFIVEASLGYFINPLLNVLLGFVLLKERLRFWQVIAVTIAALGVAWLTFHYGAFPWIALTLAVTFGFYGLLRKIAPLGAMEGLFLETLILLIPALCVMLFFQTHGSAAFLNSGLKTSLLLFASGAVTAVPLILFSSSARQISLTALGLLQYIAPTLQFMVGVLLYHETFNTTRFIGFCIIWGALAVYILEGILYSRRSYIVDSSSG
jgi:chloramphenicol-sensitive protein RarD